MVVPPCSAADQQPQGCLGEAECRGDHFVLHARDLCQHTAKSNTDGLKPFRRNPPNHGLKPRGLRRLHSVMLNRETGINCDFSLAEEPVGRRARPGCRVRDRAERAARGPVPAARALPGVPLVWLLAGAGRGPVPAPVGGEPDRRGLRSEELERPGGVGQVAAIGAERSSGPTGLSGPWGLCRVATITSCRLPARSIVSRNSWPIGASSTALENCSRFVIGWPSRDTIRSPTRRSASAAGLPALKPVTTRPAAWPVGSRLRPPPGAIIKPR